MSHTQLFKKLSATIPLAYVPQVAAVMPALIEQIRAIQLHGETLSSYEAHVMMDAAELAARQGNKEVLEALLALPVPADFDASHCRQALRAAAHAGRRDMVDLVLGRWPNIPWYDFGSAAGMAKSAGHHELAAFLGNHPGSRAA